jgi:SAM-dependent methyltransferase
MNELAIQQKYAHPDVVNFWVDLSHAGLQKCEQEMVHRYLLPQGQLLDVGCGTGRAGLALERMGYKVTGIDLSLSMLAAGRSRLAQNRLSAANLRLLPFADHSFDAVFMFFGALQHIPGRNQRRQAIAEMSRITRPGGHLILGLDNVAPSLSCYFYWLGRKLLSQNGKNDHNQHQSESATPADSTLWSREARATAPLTWHARGLVRTLRWRTWPGLVDSLRSWYGSRIEPGDIQVAQFSIPATPGRIYYHLYQYDELIDDAVRAGWRLQGYHSGTELNEGQTYPEIIRQQDKQQLFAFQKS